MSTATIQMKAHFRHRGLVFWSFFVPLLYYVPIITFLALRGVSNAAVSLWAVLAVACACAFFLASGQQEVFNRATFYLLPGMARGMVTNQVRFGLGVGCGAVILSLLLPGLSAVVDGAPVRWISVFSMAILVYGLVTQVTMQFAALSAFVFQVVWVQIFFLKPVARIPVESIARALDQGSLWTAAAGVAGYLVLQQLRSRTLHRRISGRPYLSIADVKNAEKVQEFKRLRSLHKSDSSGGQRACGSVYAAGLRAVARLRRNGRPAWALALEATLLAIFSGLPRRKWQIALWALVLPVFLVMGGFYDARNAALGNGLEAWFVGLPFMAVVWFGQIGVFLRHPAPGRLWDRGTRKRALWPALTLILGLQAATAGLLFAFGRAAAALLPPLAWNGQSLAMVPPRWEILGLVLFCLPVQMLAIALWRSPRCLQVGQQTGTMVFFVYVALFRFLDPSWSMRIAGGGVLVALSLLPIAWNWRVGRTDQA